MISIITMFFVGTAVGLVSSALSAMLLTVVIIAGVAATFCATKFLSKTFLRGIPSSFTLELPPYRKPQIAKTLVRSVFDRTLFVLGRAVAVAAPAGMIIWLMANVTVGGSTLLSIVSQFLDPIGKIMGLDGVILLAFILGFPANEIVIPIVIMAYTAGGTLVDMENLVSLRDLLVGNGWTYVTAINTIVFSLFHWPCSTTMLTIKKETGSLKWTVVSALLPTVLGFSLCVIINIFAKIF
jgi:ferrous iron transport protein B